MELSEKVLQQNQTRFENKKKKKQNKLIASQTIGWSHVLFSSPIKFTDKILTVTLNKTKDFPVLANN